MENDSPIITPPPINESLIRKELFSPYLLPAETQQDRQKIALLILSKSNEELLLMDPYAYQENVILAGLTERHLEFLAFYAPEPIKRFLWEGFSTRETIESAYNLALSLSKDQEAHRKRMLFLIRYIRDNESVFRF